MTFFRPYTRTAKLSENGVYRHLLVWEWDVENRKSACFIMLNPSTADATKDDPTIRKCIKFARAWGCGRLLVVNLFDVRATKPWFMKKHPEPVSDVNDSYVLLMAQKAFHNGGLVVCAWGMHGTHQDRNKTVLDMLTGAGITLHALRLSNSGQPYHPLYQPDDAKPFVWTP